MAKHIFLITIDALRPDHLNCYGYRKRETSLAKRWWHREEKLTD
ncbi:MAG: hypothetical protein R6U32_07165 [Candidatus Woesearchaeota archaeon]